MARTADQGAATASFAPPSICGTKLRDAQSVTDAICRRVAWMRAKTKAWVLGAAGLLGGCTDVHLREDMTAGLQRLVGHDVQDAIEKLGYPASQRTVDGEIIYTWRGRRWAGAMYVPRSPMGDADTEEPVPTGTPMTHGPQVRSACDIEIVTGRTGRIKGYEWEGNSGCRLYVRRLLP
jgi:hypothetical protein